MDKAVTIKSPGKIQNHPDTTWVFDLDNTLYPEDCDLFSKIDVRMGQFISKFLGINREQARKVQKDYFVKFGTTLKGLIEVHGIDPYEFLNFVHDIDLSPVHENRPLQEKIQNLAGKKYVFTNGDVPYATRVLEKVGVYNLMDGIFDISEADFIPKPNPEAYDRFVRRFDIEPSRAVMFEDMARNLVPASNLGMTTVWVKTSCRYSSIDFSLDHIHYETDQLVNWFDSHLEEG